MPNSRISPRLKDFDYTTPGPYFLTLCLETRSDRFGLIDADGVLILNDSGRMVFDAWSDIPKRFSRVELDAFVVMPDHLHGIVSLLPNGISDLASVVRWFKIVTTKRFGIGVSQKNWPPYRGHLWQRSFYDHVVRNEADLNRCREYIDSIQVGGWNGTDHESRIWGGYTARVA